MLQTQALTPNNFPSLADLSARILDYIALRNWKPKPINWCYTSDDLRKQFDKTPPAPTTFLFPPPLSPMPDRDRGYGIAPGGRIIHEVGVTRMGHSPSTSVLNGHCQAHDVKNLFVADGGPFVTNADKNVTWTILALAMRTSEYITEQRKAGAI